MAMWSNHFEAPSYLAPNHFWSSELGVMVKDLGQTNPTVLSNILRGNEIYGSTD